MSTPFPGMDPYLERHSLWKEIHTGLIVGIQRFLNPLLRPRYRVAIEQRNYSALLTPDDDLVGIPDLLIIPQMPSTSTSVQTRAADMAMVEPLVGELPVPEEVRERFLEIRDATTQEVITAIEILSPTNKTTRDGRRQYEKKRTDTLKSATNLVEIDLLREGRPFAITLPGNRSSQESNYRIVISRAQYRPKADVYLFGIRNPIPDLPIPLRYGETEPILSLNQILHTIYDEGSYDLAIDYSQPPQPPLAESDRLWAEELLCQRQP
ncbi:MAG TPA: DUF4058 family protein [Caldilineaceae bacterium]|nr:DUF4058 family protein [Caldilineaceae bacterium]